MAALVDIHQHLLCDMDDGPKTRREMYDMIDEAARQHISVIYATPHAAPGIRPFDVEKYQRRISQARAYSAEKGYDITICEGAEIEWTFYTVEALRKRQLPTLNGTDCVLIEFSPDAYFDEIKSGCMKLLRAGFIPVIAHTERYKCLRWHPARAIAMKEELPVKYQVNAESVLYKGGWIMRRFMRKMLAAKAFDILASDAHDTEHRPQLLRKAYRQIKRSCGPEYAVSLTSFDGAKK